MKLFIESECFIRISFISYDMVITTETGLKNPTIIPQVSFAIDDALQ
jgi:hypothetical protein